MISHKVISQSDNTGRKVSVIRDELKISGGGLYCFLPFDNLDKDKKSIFKIGLANDFSHRVEGYHTYFPNGVLMVSFLQNPPVPRMTRANPGETKKVTHYAVIEKFILNYISANGGKRIHSTTRVRNPDSESKGATEWTYIDQHTIHDAFTQAKLKFGGNLHTYNINENTYKATLKKEKDKKNTFVGEIIFHI
jgi:hypothetical protein